MLQEPEQFECVCGDPTEQDDLTSGFQVLVAGYGSKLNLDMDRRGSMFALPQFEGFPIFDPQPAHRMADGTLNGSPGHLGIPGSVTWFLGLLVCCPGVPPVPLAGGGGAGWLRGSQRMSQAGEASGTKAGRSNWRGEVSSHQKPRGLLGSHLAGK